MDEGPHLEAPSAAGTPSGLSAFAADESASRARPAPAPVLRGGAVGPDRCLHDDFERIAAETPSLTAVVDAMGSMSYGDLNKAANALAGRLQRIGASAGDVVGISTDRSRNLIVAVLGVLKAGCAYLPLDPLYPPDRLAIMLAKSRTKFVVVDNDMAIAPGVRSVEVVCSTDAVVEGARVPWAPQDLAYLIFTSGSTGRPKGVAINHSAVHLIDWAKAEYRAEHCTRVVFGTSICFDLSVFEMFFPLSVGHAVIITDSPVDMPRYAQEATLINTVPTAVKELLDRRAIPPSVRVVNLAGEALSMELVERIYDETNAERVYNLYGPSEDTTYSTVKLVRPADTLNASIGRPVPGTDVYLFDLDGNPSQPGEPGELYLAGKGLAAGYYGEPELTAERFVHIDTAEGPVRCYKTGDLAFVNKDGDLDYLGRIDHQVKINGYRIELDEIAQVASKYAGVTDTCAVTFTRDHGGSKIALFYVAEGEGGATEELLCNALRSSLPHYMIPEVVVRLERIPLTPNRKVDRSSLSQMAAGYVRPEPRAVREQAQNDSQFDALELLSAFRKASKRPTLSLDDDLFACGATSLEVTRALAEIDHRFGIRIPVRLVLKCRTLRATFQETASKIGDFHESPTAPPYLPGEALASVGQEQLWLLEAISPSPAYNVNIVLDFSRAPCEKKLRQAVMDVIGRHDALRTRFRLGSEGLCLNIERTRESQVSIFHCTRKTADAQIHRKTQAIYDLENDDLFDVMYFVLPGGEAVILLSAHHTVIDGRSVELILEDIAAAYGGGSAFEAGAQGTVTPAAHALWQRSKLNVSASDQDAAYWIQEFAGCKYADVFPVKDDRHADWRGTELTKEVTRSRVHAAEVFARRNGVTFFSVLLAAYAKSLSEVSGLGEVIIGTPVDGRRHQGLQRAVGYLVNTVAIRIAPGDEDIGSLSVNVHQKVMGAIDHQDLPFSEVVRLVSPPRQPNRQPMFQARLLVEDELEPLRLGDSIGFERRLPSTTSKFDVTLQCIRSDKGLLCKVEYKPGLVDVHRVSDMLSRFVGYVETLSN